MYKHLLYEINNGIATLTLNRPEVYNALNTQLIFELQNAFEQIAQDAQVRVVVLTGAGKAFCAGQDLNEVAELGQRSLSDALHTRYNPLIKAMRDLPIPIIGALNGVAAGAGCSLALVCDFIVAASNADLSEAFINIGLVPDSGSSFFLPRLVGALKAFELCTLGTKVTAQEALNLGLVNQVVPPENLAATVQELALRYAAAPTKAIGLIKKMLQKSFSSTLEQMLAFEASLQEIAGETEDFREGVTAFREKRKPNFTGK